MTWAILATLIGLPLLANVYLWMDQILDLIVDQAQELPGRRPWYFGWVDLALLGAPVLALLVASVVCHAWAKVRSKGLQAKITKKSRPAPASDEPDDRPMAPPGFMQGPKVRKKRKGLGPLVGLNLLAFALLAGGALTLLLAGDSLWSATFASGARAKTASLMAQVLRFAVLPLFVLSGITFGAAWGRWFPLGALEITVEHAAADRPAQNFSWTQEH